MSPADTQTKPVSRTEVLGGLIFVLILAAALYFGLMAITPMVEGNSFLLSFPDLMAAYAAGGLMASVEYLCFDISQLTFIFGGLGMALMMLASLVACHLERKGSKLAGTGVDGNGAIFPVMLVGGLVSTLVSELLYNGILGGFGFVPTLASFLFFHHLTMYYGASVQKTSAIFVVTTLLATPACLIANLLVVNTYNLPVFVCIAVGSVFFMPVAHIIFNLMPWMVPAAPGAKPAPVEGKNAWLVHQVFSDIGQLAVNGSSLAAMALVLGNVIAYVLNPYSTGVGAGLFPITIFAMLVTGALTVFLYYPKYGKEPVVSFASMLVVCAVVVTYPTSWLIVGLTILYAAVVPTPAVTWLMKVTDYKGQYCVLPMVLVPVGVALIPWCMFVQLVLVPLAG